jgi:hypothetical protein
MFPEYWRMMNGAAQMWLTVPQVIALRSARMATGGFAPGAADRRELARMVAEKTAATGESMIGMTLQLWRSSWELALAPARWWWRAWMSAASLARTTPAAAAARIVDSGLAPVRRRVRANAKRLTRRKRR